ncbi:MAG: glycosyltransferase family 2 protein [Flavobacteriales bacterium]
MKISIITICFNSAETIEETIRSVIGQKNVSIEYIVVDGGSTDNTLQIIDKYKNHISNFISEPDKGIYDAMNKGLRMSNGDIIGILNSDDVYADENALHDVIAQFEKKQPDALYADLVYVERNNLNAIKRTWISGEYKPDSFRKGWMPPHPTFFVKKQVYEKYGDFNTTLRSAADYELMLRFIHKHAISLAYLPRIITKMRQGGQSNLSLKNRLRANKEDRLAWKINGLKPGLLTLWRKPLRKISQLWKR